MKSVTLGAAIALLGAIYGVHAEDTKAASPAVTQDGPLQERPDTVPDDKKRDPGTTDTAHPEIGGDITRPRTREDVVREIFSSRPSGIPSGQANPISELSPRK